MRSGTEPGSPTFPRGSLPVILALLLAPFACSTDRSISAEERAAIDRVRASVIDLDPQSGFRIAQEAHDTGYDSRELNAWRLATAAASGAALDAEGEARAMIDGGSEDPWGWFALSAVLMATPERRTEALEPSESLVALAPEHPDAVWLRARALIDSREYEPALELLENAPEGDIPNRAGNLYEKSRALHYSALSREGIDSERLEAAISAAVEAQEVAPEMAIGWFGEGQVLLRQRQQDEAIAALRRAAELSPGSIDIQERLAWSVADVPGLSEDEKQTSVAAQVEALQIADSADASPVLSDGTIFTADWQAPELRRYSAAGEFLGVVGATGEGAGEHTRLYEIEAMPDDRVAVWPAGNGRLLLFHPDGSFDRSFLMPSSLMGQRMLEVDILGRTYIRDSDRSRWLPGSFSEPAYALHRPWSFRRERASARRGTAGYGAFRQTSRASIRR